MDAFSKSLWALALSCGSLMAHAQQYSIKEIPSVTGFTGQLLGTAINAEGVVAGWQDSLLNLANPHVFVYSKGVSTDLGDDDTADKTCDGIGGANSSGINLRGQIAVTICATTEFPSAGLLAGGVYTRFAGSGIYDEFPFAWSAGINASGWIVGTIETGAGCEGGEEYHTFLYKADTGVFQDLGTLLGCSSHGTAINDQGQIAGYFYTTDGWHAYLYSNGIATDLGNLDGSGDTFAYGINASGEVTGVSTGEPFLYANGSMQDIGRLSTERQSQGGFAINAGGEIVGSSNAQVGLTSTPHAFHYANGTIADLNALIPSADAAKFTLITAVAINDNGQIVAQGVLNSDTARTPHSFLLTPLAPAVTPLVTGKLGTNGWYVGATTLTWHVTGTPAPTESGCGKVIVPDTTGTTYTCSATNTVSSTSMSIVIKKDTVKPTVTNTTPANGATYALKSTVLASYTCADATSGIASCSGTRPVGVKIPTGTTGTHRFRVEATDNAGNRFGQTVSYTIQ